MAKKCGFTGKKCLEHDCMLWTQVMGVNGNTGQEVNDWGCAVAWLPLLLIEGSQQSRQTGAAVESFRNEMVKGNNRFLEIVGNAKALKG